MPPMVPKIRRSSRNVSTDLAHRIALHFAAILHLRRDAAMSLEAKNEVCITSVLSGMLIALLIVASVACSDATDKEDLKPTVVDAVAYAERLQVYLEEHPTFFGSAAALLEPSGEVIASPYVYRTADGYAAADAGVWTGPYFDAGGGDIWMITRSVPLRDA